MVGGENGDPPRPSYQSLGVNKADLTEVKEERDGQTGRGEKKRKRKIVPCQQWSKCIIRVSRKL